MTAYQAQAPARILVIEDDQDIAELERDYLEASGYFVTLAADGPKGLTLGLSGGFDLAILDVMLPGMDGLSVCRQLRERTSMPVIMVTARGEDVDANIRGLGVGADDYVTKPFAQRVGRSREGPTRGGAAPQGEKSARPVRSRCGWGTSR